MDLWTAMVTIGSNQGILKDVYKMINGLCSDSKEAVESKTSDDI